MKKGRNSKIQNAPRNLADIRLLTFHTHKIAVYIFPFMGFLAFFPDCSCFFKI